MLKGNLATRPFYNERLVSLAILAVALVAVLLTIYNAVQLMALSSERRALRGRTDEHREEAARIRTQAATLQSSVDPVTLARLAESTGEANDLIDQRMFSWTAFFGLIEETLPLDVRIVVVSPRVDRGVFKVSMNVVARDLADVSVFVDALRETGKFYDVAALEMQRRPDTSYGAVVEASYLSQTGRRPAEGRSAQAPSRPPR
jgi:hypothetical protein